MEKQRLLELAGMDPEMDAHYAKETKVFKQAHDALETLLKFLHSQDNFEKARGKEGEYTKMKADVADLVSTMKKHLSEY